MNQDLQMNLIPLGIKSKSVYVGPDDGSGKNPFRRPRPDEPNEKVLVWDFTPFSNSTEQSADADFLLTKKVVGRSIRDYLLSKHLIVSSDFIGRIVAYEYHRDSAQQTKYYKQYVIRVIPPRDQFACNPNSWHLNVSYAGEVEITNTALSSDEGLKAVASKVVAGGMVKKIGQISDAEKVDSETKVLVSTSVRRHLGLPANYSRVVNKYARLYEESISFYVRHLKGATIQGFLTVYESGFQPINESQIRYATRDSNLLLFGDGRTHFQPYNGLKEYGPYKSVSDAYKFFFIFHKDDADYANKLYAGLNRGLKGFPGVFRFVGLQMNLEKAKTITFDQENPITQIAEKINEMAFDQGTKYIAVYISRIAKDDLDDEKKGLYFKIKRLLLEKNVRSQVVYRDNIDRDNFNYFLPNIAIALLAKLGGIPWRLSRPIRHDLVVGLGAFHPGGTELILGTTVAFRNDGTFVKFDSSQVNSIDGLVNFFREILASVSHEWPDMKRLVIHFYKQMNWEEERAIMKAMKSLNIRIPYIVASITEEEDLVPFDVGYSGKMPVSGTCIVLRNGDYLLCNNTRYSNVAGSKIDDFPFPVRIKISKTDFAELADDDIQQIIDQVYQFSRMYWVSVKQKGKPVTVLYSEKVAAISSAFPDRALPNSDVAKKSLWFL